MPINNKNTLIFSYTFLLKYNLFIILEELVLVENHNLAVANVSVTIVHII